VPVILLNSGGVNFGLLRGQDEVIIFVDVSVAFNIDVVSKGILDDELQLTNNTNIIDIIIKSDFRILPLCAQRLVAQALGRLRITWTILTGN
jgi:hypothetical protein